MFRVKICGITTAADAVAAFDAGADAIGLNFYPRSKRYVDPQAAKEIALAVAGRGLCVGVFVNESPAAIAETAERTGLDAAQLHGDEPPSAVAEVERVTGLPVIRALRLGSGGLDAVAADLAACRAAGGNPRGVLLDAAQPGEFGGTGQTLAWDRLAGHGGRLGAPLLLAGGLTPENVAEAIAAATPEGVDVASGVESAPGVKDARLVEGFVTAACSAFEAL